MSGSCHWAAPGVRCVCIDDDWAELSRGGFAIPVRVPMQGEVLTVREARPPAPDATFGDPKAIYLDFWEIPILQNDGPLSGTIRWLATQFEPLVEQETDISVFTEILDAAPVRQTEKVGDER
jgi:hypothetical protein